MFRFPGYHFWLKKNVCFPQKTQPRCPRSFQWNVPRSRLDAWKDWNKAHVCRPYPDASHKLSNIYARIVDNDLRFEKVEIWLVGDLTTPSMNGDRIFIPVSAWKEWKINEDSTKDLTVPSFHCTVARHVVFQLAMLVFWGYSNLFCTSPKHRLKKKQPSTVGKWINIDHDSVSL